MASILNFSFGQFLLLVVVLTISAYLLWTILTAFSNIYFHDLSRFPGPKLAAASKWYKTYYECYLLKSWHLQLEELHAQYGPIVRVGPRELHFSDPQAFKDIYNNANRWDKEETIYHSFGEDRTSFGFLTYKEAKQRKDVVNKSFSYRATLGAQGIVQAKIDELCSVLTSLAKEQQLINIFHAFRCVTIDIITTYCFGASIDALHAPNFEAPVLMAMDASQPVFVFFRHFSLYMKMILNCPRPLSRLVAPETAGLVNFQEILERQINEITAHPEMIDQLPHRMTIYHSLLNPSNYASPTQIPSVGSLFEEAQMLVFAGSDTVGITLMNLAFYILQPRHAHHLHALQDELKTAYPDPTTPPPPVTHLETLPYLNAVIKESLRLACGVITGLPRIVPPSGATILKTLIPPNTIVSIGSTFVHYNADIFPSPREFDPTRWLTKDADLEAYLVPFSRGPRSCMGVNLAWLELRLTVASVFRRFELELDVKRSPEKLEFRESFLPIYKNDMIGVRIKKVL